MNVTVPSLTASEDDETLIFVNEINGFADLKAKFMNLGFRNCVVCLNSSFCLCGTSRTDPETVSNMTSEKSVADYCTHQSESKLESDLNQNVDKGKN